jgi:hypothetical protein
MPLGSFGMLRLQHGGGASAGVDRPERRPCCGCVISAEHAAHGRWFMRWAGAVQILSSGSISLHGRQRADRHRRKRASYSASRPE